MAAAVSVIGLGRVGLPLALSFADRGLDVVGIDKDPERLEAVGAGRMPFKEPGTDELLARVARRLQLSAHAADAARADAIVLTLGTPSFSIAAEALDAEVAQEHDRSGHRERAAHDVADRTLEAAANDARPDVVVCQRVAVLTAGHAKARGVTAACRVPTAMPFAHG